MEWEYSHRSVHQNHMILARFASRGYHKVPGYLGFYQIRAGRKYIKSRLPVLSETGSVVHGQYCIKEFRHSLPLIIPLTSRATASHRLRKSNIASLLPMQSKQLLMLNSNALMRFVNLSLSRRSLVNWFHKIPMMSQQKNCLSVLKKKKLNGKPCRRPTAKPKSNWRYLSIKDA